MGQIAGRRMAAEIDGDCVVFLIGARLGKLRPLRSMLVMSQVAATATPIATSGRDRVTSRSCAA